MSACGGPRVSVVVAAFNEEDSVARTLQSLLGQTIVDYEIIVVDDGSTDDTADIVESFDDHRLRLISLDENRGLPSALNRGIEASHGHYIARADADERSLPFRLKRQLNVLNKSENVQAVGCWYRVLGRHDEQVVDVKIRSDRAFDVDDLLENGPGIAHGSVMVRKDALDLVGGYREHFQQAQDYDLWLRMAEHFGEGWLDVVPQVLYERKLEASQLEKRERQRFYSYMAKCCARSRRRVGEDRQVLSQIPDKAQQVPVRAFTKRESVGLCHYLAGIKLLEQEQSQAARRNFGLAIWFAPTLPRPWYGFVSSFIPERERNKILSLVDSKFNFSVI